MKSMSRGGHHYVPRFLQRYFCDADGMLWCGFRDTQKVKWISHVDAFVKNKLYTSYEEAHEGPNGITYEPDHDRYERKFGELENRAARAINKLVVGIRHLVDGSSPVLLRSMSSAEITACKELLISMTTRTPDAMKSTIARTRLRENDDISKLVEPLRRDPDVDVDTLLQRVEQSAWAHVAASSHRDVPKCGLTVAAYSNPTSRFILGSCGVAELPIAGDPEYLDGTWLPITPNIAIALGEEPTEIILHKDRECLQRRINEALAIRSQIIAGDSKSLVKRMLQ